MSDSSTNFMLVQKSVAEGSQRGLFWMLFLVAEMLAGFSSQSKNHVGWYGFHVISSHNNVYGHWLVDDF